MPSSSTDFHKKSFRIKHDDDKFITKLLSKENPEYNSSFGVYYKDSSGSVPFTWETRPGTPKHHHFHQNSENIPPLTPPPSYYATVNSAKNAAKSKLFLHSFLRRVNSKKSHMATSCSFRDPILMSNTCYANRRRRFSSWGGDERANADDHRVSGSKGKWFYGYSSVYIMKKAFLSIVGHRPA